MSYQRKSKKFKGKSADEKLNVIIHTTLKHEMLCYDYEYRAYLKKIK